MKEILISLLAFQTPLWTHLFTFLAAFCLGFFLGRLKAGRIKPLEALMYLIILFYAIAFGRSSITSTPYPPLEITALVGAISGAMNEKLGEMIRNLRKNDK